MLTQTPGSRAAVLSDETGCAIDFAHDPHDIAELDVQLLAAQIGQSVLKLDHTWRNRNDEPASVLLEGRRQSLIAGAVGNTYVVALLLGERANVGRALGAFDEARDALHKFLS